MATITFILNTRRISGHIIKNEPKFIHLQGTYGPIVVPMRYVNHIIYDNESEKQ